MKARKLKVNAGDSSMGYDVKELGQVRKTEDGLMLIAVDNIFA